MDWLQFFKPVLAPILNLLQGQLGLNREHDVAIFRKLDAIASEARIDQVLSESIYGRIITSDDDQVLFGLIESLNRIENRYLNTQVQLRAEQLAWEMNQLLAFTHQTFFMVQGGRLKFFPDLIDSEVYDSKWNELNAKLETTWQAYKDYRNTVKDYLKI